MRIRKSSGLAGVLAAILLPLAGCSVAVPPIEINVGGSTPTPSQTAASDPTPISTPTSTDEATSEPSDNPTDSDGDDPSDEPSTAPSESKSPEVDAPTGNTYLDVEAIYIDREQYSDGTCGDIENVIARSKSKSPKAGIHYVHYSSEVEPISSTTVVLDYDFKAVVTPDDYLLTKLDYDDATFGFLSEMDECDEDSSIHPVAEEIGKMGQANHRYDGLRWQDS